MSQVEEEHIFQLWHFVFVHFSWVYHSIQPVWQVNHPFVLPNPGEKASVEVGGGCCQP
jgi:hypothetical protein